MHINPRNNLSSFTLYFDYTKQSSRFSYLILTNEFPNVIPHLRADIAPFLSEKGIRLIGVDVPSVDPLDDKELEAHHQLFKHGVHILENVVLDHVADGDYELIALPLALTDADGSPVRAVIRPI